MKKNSGMERLNADIRAFIEEKLDKGYKKFIIFPYGDVGIKVKQFLNSAYGIREEYILDNHLCKYNQEIKPVAYMENVKHDDCVVLLSSTNLDIYGVLKDSLLRCFSLEQIAELPSMNRANKKAEILNFHTEIGKYSYGPMCRNHTWIESIGAFCSFAEGADVVTHHEMQFITTHSMISAGQNYVDREVDYKVFDDEDEVWYFKGVQPHKECLKQKRIKIGNDVWLGKNVTIVNSANIGNGVIAGAGAVITKDVPDYAIVVGVPAKVIKYRYTQEQIECLNKIRWWDWSDEKIRECFDDFYLPIDEFIKKHSSFN